MPDPIQESIQIDAAPERVFGYFTEPASMVRWMGEFARLDPTPGGEFAVDIRGVPVRGRYLELDPPHRLVISWGHAGSDRLPPGMSTVEVRLTRVAGGTRVDVTHSGLPEPEATGHVQGWRFFLGRLAQAIGAGHRPANL
jgi:uncharacterized protein YndB with AHSA1/START domain